MRFCGLSRRGASLPGTSRDAASILRVHADRSVRADRPTGPRDSRAPAHLSPGVPRNAFSSLRIVVTLDKPAKYILDIGQNPENAVKATLYKEKFEKLGDQWIPDGLEPVKIPYEVEVPGRCRCRDRPRSLSGSICGWSKGAGRSDQGGAAALGQDRRIGSRIRWRSGFWRGSYRPFLATWCGASSCDRSGRMLRRWVRYGRDFAV